LVSLSAFAFEGMFKFCGSLLHGTRGFGNQIGHHLGAENHLNFQADTLFSKMDNLQLKSLCNKLRNYNVKRKGLLGIKFSSTLEDIGIFDTNFIETVEFNFNIKSKINIASRAVFDNMGMKNIIISLKFKTLI
jgi:hypothetical protein